MNIIEFFNEHKKVALAFSGGADSAYLLYAAVKCGADIAPYFVKSQFQPEFERNDAHRLAEQLGVGLHEIRVDVLQFDEVTDNPPDRCYYCKRRIMGAIRAAAAADGYDTLIDGTNASDDGSDRPGMKLLKEQNILSPLKLCGITKSEVRARSHEAGLFTWNKPAYACLATRVPAGVRLRDGGALLQFTAKQQEKAQTELEKIKAELSKYFGVIKLDPKARAESQ